MQIIISAGGGGTRLWPLSTSVTPKQFIPIFDDQSLLVKTYNRLRKEFAPSQIWITTNIKYIDIIKQLLPSEFDLSHIITEPEKRDNFAPIVSSAAIIARATSADEPLLYLPSDDWLENPEVDDIKFNNTLKIISKSLEQGKFDIITVGIKATFANTQVGYIKIDQRNSTNIYAEAVPIKGFKEKPNYETALDYFENENYFWHKHNPSFTYNSLIKNISILWPEVADIVQKIYSTGVITLEDFCEIPKTAIDSALFEKVENAGVVVMDISWNDVGNWEVANQYLPKLQEGGNQIQLSGQNNKVRLYNNNQKVAFVGVSNLLVVQTPDGLLIIDPTKSAEVKKVADYFDKV